MKVASKVVLWESKGGGGGPPPPTPVNEYLHDGLGLPADYPGGVFDDGVSYTMGHPFCVLKAGQITAVRFWKCAEDITSSHQVAIYADGNPIALSSEFSSSEPSGPCWIEVVLSSPVTVTDAAVLTQRFIAGVFRQTGKYPATTGGPMTFGHYSPNSVMYSPSGTSSAEAATYWTDVDGNNTFYSNTFMAYPGGSFGAAYYWVDVRWTGFL